jgi:hypothetical protein
MSPHDPESKLIEQYQKLGEYQDFLGIEKKIVRLAVPNTRRSFLSDFLRKEGSNKSLKS